MKFPAAGSMLVSLASVVALSGACTQTIKGAMNPRASGKGEPGSEQGADYGKSGGKGQVCPEGLPSFASGLNVLVLGDATLAASDVEGRLGIMGQASLTDYSVGDRLAKNANEFHLIAGSDLKLLRGSTANGGTAYAGSLSAESWVFFSEAVKTNTAFDFAAAQSKAVALSQQTAALAANANITPSDPSERVARVLEGKAQGVNVFAINTAQLANSWRLTIKAPQGSTAIINVTGEDAKVDAIDIVTEGIAADHILFNFVDAKKLAIKSVGLTAAVLAPLAATESNSNVVIGNVVVKSLTGGGQFNLSPFVGCVEHGKPDHGGGGKGDGHSGKGGKDKPSYDKPSDKPSYDKPSYDKPSYDKPSYDKPSYDKPSYDKPSKDQDDDKGYDKPAAKNPHQAPVQSYGPSQTGVKK